MHDTGFRAGDIVQRPEQAIEIANVFQYKTGNKAVFASDYDALNDLWQFVKDLLDRAKLPRQGLYRKDSFERKSENSRIQAHAEGFDNANIL